jgi:hypothetical protein
MDLIVHHCAQHQYDKGKQGEGICHRVKYAGHTLENFTHGIAPTQSSIVPSFDALTPDKSNDCSESQAKRISECLIQF